MEQVKSDLPVVSGMIDLLDQGCKITYMQFVRKYFKDIIFKLLDIFNVLIKESIISIHRSYSTPNNLYLLSELSEQHNGMVKSPKSKYNKNNKNKKKLRISRTPSPQSLREKNVISPINLLSPSPVLYHDSIHSSFSSSIKLSNKSPSPLMNNVFNTRR